jgi:hypothetical protein
MIQEIITYLIIAAAFFMAGWKISNKLRRKKRKKNVDFKNDKITLQHNCSDCAAECILRDASTSYIKSNADTCQSNYTEKD